MSESNIRAGLKNTGIYPVNYEAMPTSKMTPSYVTDVFRNDTSKNMLNALHLKILYLKIIVRFLIYVCQLIDSEFHFIRIQFHFIRIQISVLIYSHFVEALHYPDVT